jgi:hypothetical protein
LNYAIRKPVVYGPDVSPLELEFDKLSCEPIRLDFENFVERKVKDQVRASRTVSWRDPRLWGPRQAANAPDSFKIGFVVVPALRAGCWVPGPQVDAAPCLRAPGVKVGRTETGIMGPPVSDPRLRSSTRVGSLIFRPKIISFSGSGEQDYLDDVGQECQGAAWIHCQGMSQT